MLSPRFCGGKETLALYRPNTGIVYYFDGWPDPSSDADAPNGYADATGIRDATPVVGDRNGDGCADLALEVGGARTWFQPAVQPGRLQLVPIPPG